MVTVSIRIHCNVSDDGASPRSPTTTLCFLRQFGRVFASSFDLEEAASSRAVKLLPAGLPGETNPARRAIIGGWG